MDKWRNSKPDRNGGNRLAEAKAFADVQTNYNIVALFWSLALAGGIGLPLISLLMWILFRGNVTFTTEVYWIMGIAFVAFWPLEFLRRRWLRRYNEAEERLKD